MLGQKVREKVGSSKLVTSWAAEAWCVRSGLTGLEKRWRFELCW